MKEFLKAILGLVPDICGFMILSYGLVAKDPYQMAYGATGIVWLRLIAISKIEISIKETVRRYE